MPIHDWTKIRAGAFHCFHQAWTIEIYKALNRGVLPAGYFALAEQVTGGPIPDVVCLEKWPVQTPSGNGSGGIAVAEKPPAVKPRIIPASRRYAAKANRITIREPLGEVVAVIEIVSPGNKSDRAALEAFVQKAVNLLCSGIHLFIVDLFPPGRFDEHGIHQAIQDGLGDAATVEAMKKPLAVVSYMAGVDVAAYVDELAVGDPLPAAPVFLQPDRYVPVPLEETYQTTWSDLPLAVRELFTA